MLGLCMTDSLVPFGCKSVMVSWHVVYFGMVWRERVGSILFSCSAFPCLFHYVSLLTTGELMKGGGSVYKTVMTKLGNLPNQLTMKDEIRKGGRVCIYP